MYQSTVDTTLVGDQTRAILGMWAQVVDSCWARVAGLPDLASRRATTSVATLIAVATELVSECTAASASQRELELRHARSAYAEAEEAREVLCSGRGAGIACRCAAQ